MDSEQKQETHFLSGCWSWPAGVVDQYDPDNWPDTTAMEMCQYQVISGLFLSLVASVHPSRPPNVLFIVADDLGNKNKNAFFS